MYFFSKYSLPSQKQIVTLKFSDFNFEGSLIEGLESMRFETPTPIQEKAIPIIFENKDLIACAQTGTGKTAAFLLPILNKLVRQPVDHINTLILLPTRELALQINQVLTGFSYFTSVSFIPVYGGSDENTFDREKNALKQNANIVVATPGRLMTHINLGYVNFDNLQHLILDEADRMLDMGFIHDILRIINFLPKKRQTLLFSATMPPKVRSLTNKILHNPEFVEIAISKPAEGILQAAYLVYDDQKNELIQTLLKGKANLSAIIFASTKQKVKLLERDLQKAKFNVHAIHSDLEQSEREKVLLSFRNKQTQILVATNIVSRGIDIEDIGLIINYDVPDDAEDYIHRVGRTARAEATGVALTLINNHDQQKFLQIESLIGEEIKKLPLPASIGTGPEYNPQIRKKRKPYRRKGKPGKK